VDERDGLDSSVGVDAAGAVAHNGRSTAANTGPSDDHTGPPDDRSRPFQPGAPARFGHTVGFLLSQLGYAVTRQFRAELEDLSLEPRHFGLLRAIDATNGATQHALGDCLQIPASSVVALLDGLEEKGLVRRRLDPGDRRIRVVELTEQGRVVLARAGGIAAAIESAICLGFDTEQRERLIATLHKVGSNLGITLGVHPSTQEERPSANAN